MLRNKEAQLQGVLSETDNMNEKLKRDLKDLKQKLWDHQQSCNAQTKQLTDLKHEIERLESEKRSQESEIDRLREELTDLRAEKEKLAVENSDLKFKFHKLQIDLSETDLGHKMSKEEVEKLKLELLKRDDECGSLKKVLAEKENEQPIVQVRPQHLQYNTTQYNTIQNYSLLHYLLTYLSYQKLIKLHTSLLKIFNISCLSNVMLTVWVGYFMVSTHTVIFHSPPSPPPLQKKMAPQPYRYFSLASSPPKKLTPHPHRHFSLVSFAS